MGFESAGKATWKHPLSPGNFPLGVLGRRGKLLGVSKGALAGGEAAPGIPPTLLRLTATFRLGAADGHHHRARLQLLSVRR